MKAIFATVMMMFFIGSMFAQSVGINNDGSSPNSKAMLDVSSTTKGFLPPRMTTAQILAIETPPEGLMVYNTTLKILVFYNGTLWAGIPGQFYIGESYGGGIIFYIDGTGQHGLIAATSDQSSGTEWGCYGTTIGNTSTGIGTGQANTTRILNFCYTAGIAAKICDDLVLNGYSDWFLPSKDELNQLYLQKTVVGGFADYYYWSSSESEANNAWNQYFYDGHQGYSLKSNSDFYVRAIRTF